MSDNLSRGIANKAVLGWERRSECVESNSKIVVMGRGKAQPCEKCFLLWLDTLRHLRRIPSSGASILGVIFRKLTALGEGAAALSIPYLRRKFQIFSLFVGIIYIFRRRRKSTELLQQYYVFLFGFARNSLIIW